MSKVEQKKLAFDEQSIAEPLVSWEMDKYDALKKKIEMYEISWVPYKPSPKFPESKKVTRKDGMVPICEVYTEVLGKEFKSDGTPVEIRGRERFNLSTDVEGNISVPKTDNSNLKQFILHQGVTTLKGLIGTQIVTRLRKKKNSTMTFVGFYTQ